jgi:Mor family transcriptional regulator
MNTFDIDPDLLSILPPVCIQVVRALGIARARELLLEFGGQDVTIAKHHSRALRLTDRELARLRECLAGHMDHVGRVYLPKADKLINHFRDEQIRREADRKSIRTQVTEYKLSRRQILNIRADERDEACENRSRKSLNLTDAEITAITHLAKVQLGRNENNPLLQRVLNKLARARIASKATGAKASQFDLF